MTRPGWTAVAAALTAVVIGRVFGVFELYVIGAGLAAAVVAGLLTVRLRPPRLEVSRWIHPPILTVGDTGRVDLSVRNAGRARSPRVSATEPVGRRDTARLSIAPLGRGERVDAAYRIPAERRGVMDVGPLVVERRDLFGVATSRHVAAPLVEVVVAPRTHDLAMPELGRGALGRLLLTQAQRLGSGEFHSLRDYQRGDELRLVDWKASARSEELKVRQNSTEGVRRCIVVLDRSAAAYGADPTPDDAFERAVEAAASLVFAADRHGLTTRFITAGGVDLRGPDVASTTLRVLARLDPTDEPLGDIERDPGEGLGLVLVVTHGPGAAAWRRTEAVLDPSLVRVGVFTGEPGRRHVDATSPARFVDSWNRLAGRGALDRRPRSAAPATPERPDPVATGAPT